MKGTELARDIALLKQTLLEAHPSIVKERNDFNPNFDFLTQEQFDLAFDDAARKAEAGGEFSPHEALKLLLPLITGLNDEHVELPFAKTEAFCRENRLPVTFLVLGDVLQIATSEHPSLSQGDVVSAIEGVPANKLIEEMEHWFSGTSREMRLALLSLYFEEALKLYFNDPDKLVITCNQPTVLRYIGTKQTKAAEYVCTGGEARLNIRSFTGDKKSFQAVVSCLFEDIAKQGAKKLTIDIRDNQGGVTAYGDSILSRIAKVPFSQLIDSEIRLSPLSRKGFEAFLPGWLVKSGLHKLIPVYGKLFRAKDGESVKVDFREKKPKGDFAFLDVEVLVNKASMSTSSLFAATIEQYQIGRVIGETGGFPSHFGNQFTFELPSSHICVSIPVSKNRGHGFTCVSGDAR